MAEKFAAFRRIIKADFGILQAYASLMSGSLGKLVLSLGYFVCIANALSIADFGLFATASATGVMLSRICGLGFYSPLYRVSTVKPRLIGTYTAGYLAASLASLPLVALAALVFWVLVFAGDLDPLAFSLILAAEILGWRSLEIVIIVNNGIGRFGRGAVLTVLGTGIKAAAAAAFLGSSDGSLFLWAVLYLAANLLSAVVAIAWSYPRRRLRFAPKLYAARWRDSVSVAGADMVFYLQSDLDKLLVLAFGGPAVAGLYAILMRLVDLTALPVRSFNTLIVQKMMKTPALLDSWRRRIGIEGIVALVSVMGLSALGLFLAIFPRALGDNVADAAPLVILVALVPAFRNLVEYESELLYAAGRTGIRVFLLAALAAGKGALLVLVLTAFDDTRDWVLALNPSFAALWLASAVVAYAALDAERRKCGRRGSRFGAKGLQHGE